MRPVDEQVVLVTGATDGLGRRLAEALAARGATVLLHGRSDERLAAARAEIAAATGAQVATYPADLASLSDVRRLAADVRRDRDHLDALVNNAGVIVAERRESQDGHELTFAVNYLAHFLLTLELLPLLRPPARIVNVASAAQESIDFDDLMFEHGYQGRRAYARSKLAQVLFTVELARRLPAGVTVNALHPASLMDTKMVHEHYGAPMSTVDEGVEATLRLLVDPALDGVSGRYFDGTAPARCHRQAEDADARRRLWELSEELTSAA